MDIIEQNHLDKLKLELLSKLNYDKIENENMTSFYRDWAIIISSSLAKKIKLAKRARMGVNISHVILNKLFEPQERCNFHVNTLNKLSIFLGYESWLGFKNNKQTTNKQYSERRKDIRQDIIASVIDYIKMELRCYKDLPKLDLNNFKVIYKSSTRDVRQYESLLERLRSLNKDNKQLIDYYYNLLECRVLSISKQGRALVRTKENLILIWEYQNTGVIEEVRYNSLHDEYYYHLYKQPKRPNANWQIVQKAVFQDAYLADTRIRKQDYLNKSDYIKSSNKFYKRKHSPVHLKYFDTNL